MIMTFNNALLKRIYERAEKSQCGLDEKPDGLNFSHHAEPHSFQTLAMILIGGHHQKYDLISVMQAALEIVAEDTANNQPKKV